jgi:hypothetical protein
MFRTIWKTLVSNIEQNVHLIGMDTIYLSAEIGEISTNSEDPSILGVQILEILDETPDGVHLLTTL